MTCGFFLIATLASVEMRHMGMRGGQARTRAVVWSYLVSRDGAGVSWRIALRLLRAGPAFFGDSPTAETVHAARVLLERFERAEARPRRVFLAHAAER